MMQHQHCDRGRKCFLRKGQRRRIALQDIAVWTLEALRKPGGKSVAVFKACHSSRMPSQLFRRRAWSCAKFQRVLAQFRAGQKPRYDLCARHAPPI